MTLYESASGARPRRRRLGDGMMKPVRALEIKDPYTGWCRLIPGVHQVSTDYWAYQRNPEYFMPVNRDDSRTVARHRRTLQTHRRKLERELGTTRATTSSKQKRFQLPDRRRERFRLP